MLSKIKPTNTIVYSKTQPLTRQNTHINTQLPFDSCCFSEKTKTKICFKGNSVFQKISQKVAGLDEKKLAKLKLGNEINGGTEATVYEVKKHPEWVIRIKNGYDFEPEKLKLTGDSYVIAQNEDKSCQILKKIQGTPLHGKYWDLFRIPKVDSYLKQLKAFEEIPDEAFIKYMKNVLELRKKGYELDTINPNNILYDERKKEFNILDTKNKENIPEVVTLKDFYPFLDGRRIGKLYRESDSKTREEIRKNACAFIDRIIKIGNENGFNLATEDIDHSNLQDFLVYYLYYNNKSTIN